MLFYMNSKELVKYFLPFERDKDILNGWYVLVSSRISGRSADTSENIISAKNILFPDAETCSTTTDARFVKKYNNQLKSNKAFFASIIKSSIEEHSNIFFLCSEKEDRLKFFQIMAEYISKEFEYPMYRYIEFSANCELVPYDEKKVLAKCNKILDESQRKGLAKNGNKKEQAKYFKNKSKKELKELLKKENLYTKGMDKEEMLETIELYKEAFL